MTFCIYCFFHFIFPFCLIPYVINVWLVVVISWQRLTSGQATISEDFMSTKERDLILLATDLQSSSVGLTKQQLKERVEARNNLESYSYSLKRQIDDKEQLGGKINDDDKESIQSIVDEKLEWLRDHEEATASEFNAIKKEIEEVANPIIAKLYSYAPPPEEEGSTGHEDEL